MRDLKITLIQTELSWEDISANLEMFDKKIDMIEGKTDLIILPEMFTTGFSMNASDHAQNMSGSSVRWIQDKSRETDADLIGSVIIRENENFFNRLFWAKPTGELFTYDKRHLYRMLGEDKVFSPGNTLITVKLHDWKIRPFICYDLRFPAWTRNINNKYDLAIFIANWPHPRAEHWKTLLLARAIENLCYVVGVNRVGMDGNGNNHTGDSSVIDPQGKILFHKSHEECIHTMTLSYDALQEYRRNFPAWMDADDVSLM